LLTLDTELILRLSYPLQIGFKFTPSLLPIYHLSNDKFTDASGFEQEIIGSQGIALNANFYLDYNLSTRDKTRWPDKEFCNLIGIQY